ncbi:MAG: DUF3795 domain-containing protein [Dehalococcoidia bacterium]|nr:MAG: DUF3795 domain-containing protein [Dehalococcoidia bacterium]
MAEKIIKRFPTIGACGLDCGLCPRHHTDGVSRCPGCAAAGFGSWGCGLQKCCVQEHHLECCAECPDTDGCLPLERLVKQSAKADSFISYLPVPANHQIIHDLGITEAARRQDARVTFLDGLLKTHNDGRSKGFYCLAVQLLPLEELQSEVNRLSAVLSAMSEVKERAVLLRQAFNELAVRKGLTLKLRRHKKEGES